MFRCLYDYTYECDIQKAYIFWCFYFIFEFYILINLALFAFFILLNGDFTITFHNGYTAGLGFIIYVMLFAATPIPLILNGILTISIMLKKRAKLKTITPFAFIFAVSLLVLSCFIPHVFGIAIGLIPPVFLMQKDDNSLEKQVKAMEKENLEQKIMVEKLLIEEQVKRMKEEELNKINYIQE